MGVIKFFSSSSFDNTRDVNSGYQPLEVTVSSPDPSKYITLNVKVIGKYLIVKVQYEEATNYEGVKILLFKGVTMAELLKKNGGVIDPHFSDNKEYISPIARFVPTEEGWRMAVEFCEIFNDN